MNKILIVLSLISATLLQGVSTANSQEIPSKIRGIIDGFLGEPAKTSPVYPDGAQTRAMNLARQAAERANGGLNNYRAETSMYGPATQSPFKDNGNSTLTFTFLGGQPTAPPTLKSVVTVSLTSDAVTLDFNGPIQLTRE